MRKVHIHKEINYI